MCPLSSGPLPTTVGHFWLTVWQQNSKAVLMLNRVFEKGQLKCHQYWPVDQGEDMLFEDVGLKLENVHSVPGNHYTVRKFRCATDGRFTIFCRNFPWRGSFATGGFLPLLSFGSFRE